jgi:rhodanese-related sulfurtransferase
MMMKGDTEVAAIKHLALERARTLNLGYSGALLPVEAYRLMQEGATLVDVRTRAELDWVGRVPGALWIEWNRYPGAQLNPDFLAQLGELTDKGDAIMFICRSGARSHFAANAATQAGWLDCYNVLEGFEGDKDANQHRGTVSGWRMAGLPWVQS